DLLSVGNQYRTAIQRYVLAGKAQYPQKLEVLLKDPRQPSIQRYLRKLYPDPMTGKSEWGFVKGPDGGIGGVYSLSEDKPLKVAGFKLRDASLEGAQKYSDWKIVFSPAATATPAASAPATPAASATATPAAPAPAAPAAPAPATPDRPATATPAA